MRCHSCGNEVRPGQKFCAECGSSLRGVADTTGEVPVISADETISDSARDEVNQAMGRLDRKPPSARPGPTTAETVALGPDAAPPPPDGLASAFGSSPQLVDDATRAAAAPSASPYAPRRLDPDSMLQPIVPPAGAARSGAVDVDATTRLPAAGTGQDPTTATPAAGTGYGWIPGEAAGPAADPTTVYARAEVLGGPVTGYSPEVQYVEQQGAEGWEEQWPAGPPARRPHRFRLRILFLLALLAAGAAAVGVASTVIEIRPDAANAPFDTGTWMVNDFGTNNTVGALIATGLMVVGGFLWCFGFRWGAGLAGGAGLGLAGWAALLVGLAEWPLFRAEEGAGFVTSTISREVGYWGVVAAGGLGVLAFLASLGGSGRDAHGGLDPWIAALGAASMLVAAGGPLIPLGSAEFSGNYSSETLAVELPDLFFVGRLVQVGLLAFAGIIGFLLVRRYGLGLAIGGAAVAGWMVATSATEQTVSPIGLAFANPGAGIDLRPHGVTIVGMALAGFFTLVAVVMALLDTQR